MHFKLQRWIPKKLLTRTIGWLAHRKLGWISQGWIKIFISHFKVNMNEAIYPDRKSYHSFAEFFCRKLKPNIRHIDQRSWIVMSPVDGSIAECGAIKCHSLIQAKHINYTTQHLLASHKYQKKLQNGSFFTFYLSPKDYHRIHMPISGTLREMIYIPGNFYSVNTHSAENIPQLYCQNERVICTFNTDIGLMLVVFVGAMIVGGIETIWHGRVKSNKYFKKHVMQWHYQDNNHHFKRGEEIGLFTIGSTVIVLFEHDAVQLSKHLQANQSIQLGDQIALTKNAP